MAPPRDTAVRYCGYANELGEAFAAWLPVGGVPASYAVAITYVCADTIDKAKKAYKETVAEAPDSPALATAVTQHVAVDTLVWQLLASVAIPGFTIHTIVHYVTEAVELVIRRVESGELPLAPLRDLLAAQPESAELLTKTLPTMVGLAAIPMIVHPIDNTVHKVLDLSLRKMQQRMICDVAGGADAGLQRCQPARLEVQDVLASVEDLYFSDSERKGGNGKQ
ncbi:unnamed protein product [Pedinophyceae sp. YPF-701]|nr:unnamed protein product [Pedinophyceae sp. YPF-701]